MIANPSEPRNVVFQRGPFLRILAVIAALAISVFLVVVVVGASQFCGGGGGFVTLEFSVELFLLRRLPCIRRVVVVVVAIAVVVVVGCSSRRGIFRCGDGVYPAVHHHRHHRDVASGRLLWGPSLLWKKKTTAWGPRGRCKCAGRSRNKNQRQQHYPEQDKEPTATGAAYSSLHCLE